MSLFRRGRLVSYKIIFCFTFFLFIYVILVYKVHKKETDVASIFTSLYWEQRSAKDSDSNEELSALLSKVNLWRPTDEFVGNWNYNYDDRILQQILWAKNIRPNTTKRIALPDGFAWWWFTKESFNAALRRDCPNLANYCEFTEIGFSPTDEDVADLDAVLMNFASSTRDFPTGNFVKAVYALESSFHASAHLTDTDLLCSYWRGSDIPTPYGKWVYYDPLVTAKTQGRNYAKGKTKMAAIFTSNCSPPNRRLDFVHELQNHGLSVDVYGVCGTLTCSREDADSCFEKLKKEYKFYLAFENSNCRDYITEKFFGNAMKNDIVPVVMGGTLEDYEALTPRNSFIHIDSFGTVDQLVKHLHFLSENDDEYNKLFEWKGTGEFIDLNFFCRFCGMMYYADVVPLPIRNQSLEFSVSGNQDKAVETRPCLPRGRVHWNNFTS